MDAEAVFNGKSTKAARGKPARNALWKIAGRKLEQLDSAATLEDLRVPPGNRPG
jgi:proteic killer suppression protein